MNLDYKQDKRSHIQRGFTLIELVLVMTIITILVGSGIYMTMGQTDSAKFNNAESTVQALSTQLLLYEKDNKRLPTTEQGLMALVEKPSTSPVPPRWTKLYKKEGLTDPWDNTYRYAYFPKKDGRSGVKFDIWSIGPDGVDGNEDDIGNWSIVDDAE